MVRSIKACHGYAFVTSFALNLDIVKEYRDRVLFELRKLQALIRETLDKLR
jgi:hypothetical protein